MEIIDINLPPGDAGDFFCPFTGQLQMDNSGVSSPSCVAYIPPPVFAEARITCPHFEKFWDNLLNEAPAEMWEQVLSDLYGDILLEYLIEYEGLPSQKLIGFRVKTTSTVRLNAPEFDCPIYTIACFYVVDFWCKSQK
jgi:hypothetical protein